MSVGLCLILMRLGKLVKDAPNLYATHFPTLFLMPGGTQEAPPLMKVFTSTLQGEEELAVNLKVILGKGCCHVWMGDAREAPRMGAMCVATMTKFDSDASSSVLLHDGEEDFADSIASRLCKRLKMMVFVSCSLSASDAVIPIVARLERQILDFVREDGQVASEPSS